MMTVRELINMLEDTVACGTSENTPVQFSYGAGDYWRTTVADHIDKVGIEKVSYSEYHRKNVVLEDHEDNDEDEPENTEQVVIIS